MIWPAEKPLGWSSRKFHTCLGIFHAWFPIQGLVPGWEAPGPGMVCSAGAGRAWQRAPCWQEHHHLHLAVAHTWVNIELLRGQCCTHDPSSQPMPDVCLGMGTDQQTVRYTPFSKFLWLYLPLAYIPQEKVGQENAIGTLHCLHRRLHPFGVLWCGPPHAYHGVTLGDRVSLRRNNSVCFSQLPVFTKLWRNLLFLRCSSSSLNLGGNQPKHLQPVHITSSQVI